MQATNVEQTASARPSKFSMRGAPPTPGKKINGTTVVITTGVFSILAIIVLLFAFSSPAPEPRPVATSSGEALPGSQVSELPANYAELARRQPPRPEPQRVESVGTPERVRGAAAVSAEDKLAEELRVARLKRALEARQSDVSFRNVRTDRPVTEPNVPGGAAGLLPPAVNEPTSADAGLNPRDLDGRQDEKREFLERSRGDETTLMQRVKPLLSDYQVMAGTVIPGVMLTGINSDLPGQILGQVSQRVFDSTTGSTVLIPQGTKVLGTYDSRVVYGQERVLVVWTRLIFPNGRSLSLEGMPGIDMSGYAGLSDRVNNHYGKLLTGVVLSSILGAGAQIAEGGTSTVDPTFGQLAAQGTAKNINEAGQQITRKNLSIQPTLEISPGFRFNIFVTKDLLLEAYDA